MKVRDVIKRVEADGWYYDYTVGSHRHSRHSKKPGKTTIPGQLFKEVPAGTLARIWKQAGLSKP